MENIIKKRIKKINRPIKVLQFGEGNFLRGFADYMIDILNEKTDFNGNVVIIKPIAGGDTSAFDEQDSIYTVMLRGIFDGKKKTEKRIVTCCEKVVSCTDEYKEYSEYAKLDSLRFIISNTTEAGIVYDSNDNFAACPPNSYPGKLTKFLYERYTYFKGDRGKGLIILPVELIDDNGAELNRIVKLLAADWRLENAFTDWLDSSCVFASTLVDRIVTGYPREKSEADEIFEEIGYTDKLLVTGEPFALWVIEAEKDISAEIPFDKAGLPVIFTDNQKPYKERKVRILNGAHTSLMPVSFLAGNEYVGQSMNDAIMKNYVLKIVFEEIIPTLSLPENELKEFANAVTDRFENPFIKHSLLSISLNGISKWKARCLPSLLGYIERKKALPKRLVFSLAATAVFYRKTDKYSIKDDAAVFEFFAENSDLPDDLYIKNFLSNKSFFGIDLTMQKGLYDKTLEYFTAIKNDGIRTSMERYL